MKHKRIVLALLLVALICTMLPVTALAETVYVPVMKFAESGQIGDDVYYTFDETNRTLRIYGSGETWDFAYSINEDTPISPFANKWRIKYVIVEEGVTLLKNDLFVECENLIYIIIPKGCDIGRYMIHSCENAVALFFYGEVPSDWFVSDNNPKLDLYYLPDVEGWEDFIYEVQAEVPEDYIGGCYMNSAKPFCGIPYTDVPCDVYYTDAVKWSWENGLLKLGANTTKDNSYTIDNSYGEFHPNGTCRRQEVMTLLWRANGSPEPAGTTDGFKDVKDYMPTYSAILWAAENGIASGYDNGGFEPYHVVTRAQAMTFLWRANGCPEVPEGTVNTFKDVPETAYYHDAVLWAVANGITSGYNDTQFGPMDGCTRAQIVTFLYRSMAVNPMR